MYVKQMALPYPTELSVDSSVSPPERSCGGYAGRFMARRHVVPAAAVMVKRLQGGNVSFGRVANVRGVCVKSAKSACFTVRSFGVRGTSYVVRGARKCTA